MSLICIHQPVYVFDERIPPNEAGVIGRRGTIVAVDYTLSQCTIELNDLREQLNVPFSEVLGDDGQLGLSTVGETVSGSSVGVYRSRKGWFATYIFRRYDQATIEFKLTMATTDDGYARIEVQVPTDFDLSRSAIKQTLSHFLGESEAQPEDR